jgi:hypothetical protein
MSSYPYTLLTISVMATLHNWNIPSRARTFSDSVNTLNLRPAVVSRALTVFPRCHMWLLRIHSTQPFRRALQPTVWLGAFRSDVRLNAPPSPPDNSYASSVMSWLSASSDGVAGDDLFWGAQRRRECLVSAANSERTVYIALPLESHRDDAAPP